MGSGTTGQVAIQHGRQYLGCELNQDYSDLQQERIAKAMPAIVDDPQMSLVLEMANAP
jgi:DNA modification methylase